MKKDYFVKEFDSLNAFTKKTYKACNKIISHEISNIQKDISSELQEKFSSYITDKIIKDSLTTNLIKLYSSCIDYLYSSVMDLNKSLKEVVSFVVENPMINVKSLYAIEKDYKNKLKDLGYYKKMEQLTNSSLDIFAYNISIAYKLKYNVEGYEFIEKIVYEYKLRIKNNILNIIDNTKNSIFEKFKSVFYDFSKSIITENKSVRDKNFKAVSDYAYQLLQVSTVEGLKNSSLENTKEIEKILNEMKDEIFKKTKLKKTDNREQAFYELKDYFISFINTIRNKQLKIINDMNRVVYLDKDLSQKELEKYSKLVYKIINMEYNFDKPLLVYKNKLLKQVILNKDKLNYEMSQIIEEYKEQTVNLFKSKVGYILNEDMVLLTDINYRCINAKNKIANCLEVISDPVIKTMF